MSPRLKERLSAFCYLVYVTSWERRFLGVRKLHEICHGTHTRNYGRLNNGRSRNHVVPIAHIRISMKTFLRSFRKWFTEATANNEYVIRLGKRYPRFFSFVKRRLSTTEPYGFSFCVGIALAVLAFASFIGITEDVLSHEQFVAADARIMNLIVASRDFEAANVPLFFTYLSNWQIITSLGVVMLVPLLLLGKQRIVIFFLGAVVGSTLIYLILNELLHRTRPDIGFSLISRGGYAFPSGHAGVSLVFYGMIGFVLCRALKRLWQKLIVAAIVVALVFLIGSSRVYLGVHWPSDVVAGWAVGFAVLALFATCFHERERFRPERQKKGARKSLAVIVFVCLVIVEVSFVYLFYIDNPLEFHEPQMAAAVIVPPSSDSLFKTIESNDFPKLSESLLGQKMEPISFIVVTSEDGLIKTLTRSGWFVADDWSAGTSWHIVNAAILNRSYPTAPVTPSFLAAQPDGIAFEKPTETNTVRERHHIRFWLTNFRYGNDPILVATASFDKGIRCLITHDVRPDIDTEREYVKDELCQTGNVHEVHQIQVVPRLLGEPQANAPFFTDGKAYVILLQ